MNVFRHLLICAATLVTGCSHEAPQPASPAAPRPSVALRILVVNEPELAESIDRFRGEWNERSGGELKAVPTTWAEVAAADRIDADVVVFPSRYLGGLCVRSWLRPVRSSVLKNVDSNDFFPLVRNELIKWDGATMALPLGIDPGATGAPFYQSGKFWLLTQAAQQAISNERLGALFDHETMKPRITEPVFVDALKEVDQFFWENLGLDKSALLDSERRLPVLGYNDRLIAVTTSSRNAASAFKLIEWLAHPETSS